MDRARRPSKALGLPAPPAHDGPMRRLAIITLCVLLFVGFAIRPATETRSGPILQQVGPFSALVLQHGHPELGPKQLRYRAAGTDEWSSAANRGSALRSEFRLRELIPGQEYEYELHAGTQLLGEGRFRSAPPPGAGSVRVAAIGDSGDLPYWKELLKYDLRLSDLAEPLLGHQPPQWRLARDAASLSPDLVLHLGDVVYPKGAWNHYEDTTFRPFARLFAMADVHATIGNHDAMTEQAEPLLGAFEPAARGDANRGRYYEFVRGPVHFFNVDSYTTSFSKDSEQRRWFEERVRASTSPWKVMFTHRPLWSSSRSQKAPPSLAWREDLHPFLAEQGVQFVFSGHDHTYQRYKARDGVHYIVAGGGGHSLYYLAPDEEHASAASRFSYVMLDFDPRSVRLEARGLHGVVFDTLELSR
jgi:predicted phosphodiesterase